jgi:hypothetical protein
MAAQRHILQLINRRKWEREELFGLSSKAIERWVSVNRLEPESRLVKLVKTASSQLFFLANKSQEQVSEGYKLISREIGDTAETIELELGMMAVR